LFKGVPPLLTTLLTFGFIFFAVRRLEKVRIFALAGATATGKSTLIKLITKNLKHL
jgi:ABC-type transport system involved in cytochrome bd biosynthesis fused ATPase/permease subunit